MFLRLLRAGVFFVMFLGLLTSCRQRATSSLQSAGPDAAPLDGFAVPLHGSEYAMLPPEGETLDLGMFQVILELDPIDVAGKNGRVIRTPQGDSMLVTSPDGNLPSPEFSTKAHKGGAKQEVYQWVQLAEANGADIKPLGLYYKTNINKVMGDDPSSYDPNDLWAMRFPKSSEGDPIAVMIPWQNHFRLGESLQNGGLFYRLGNSIVSAHLNEVVMNFDEIGRYVWRYWGVADFDRVCSGTLFWAQLDQSNGQPTGTYYSAQKDADVVHVWRRQMDVLVHVEQQTKDAVRLPRLVADNLESCRPASDKVEFERSVSTGILDRQVIYLQAGAYAQEAYREMPAKATNLSDRSQAFDAWYEYVGEEKEAPAGLNLTATITPFQQGQKYEPGSLIQAPDGRIHRVVKTVEQDGWFSDYYHYETLNYSHDNDGERQRIVYTLDHKGRVIDKSHIKTYAASIAREIERRGDFAAENIQKVAEQMERNREQLRFAEIAAGRVDSAKKLLALTAVNYAVDQVGRALGGRIYDKNLGLNQRLLAGGGLAATSAVTTGLISVLNNEEATVGDHAKVISITGLSAGGAWSTAALGAGDARVSLLAGVGREVASLMMDQANGYDVPDWKTTAARLSVAGGVVATQGHIYTKAAETIASQNLTGAAAQKVANAARAQVIGIGGVLSLSRLYFQGNLTTSAATGSVLSTAVAAIPAGPGLAGVAKAMAMTLAKQVDALLQLGESLARNSSASGQMDDGLRNLRNKRAAEAAIRILEEADQEVFWNLEASGRARGIPAIIQERRPESANAP